MMPPWLLIAMCSAASLLLLGTFVLGCMEEARKRRESKDTTLQAMLTALRIHEAAQEARVLMTSEIRRIAELDE